MAGADVDLLGMLSMLHVCRGVTPWSLCRTNLAGTVDILRETLHTNLVFGVLWMVMHLVFTYFFTLNACEVAGRPTPGAARPKLWVDPADRPIACPVLF